MSNIMKRAQRFVAIVALAALGAGAAACTPASAATYGGNPTSGGGQSFTTNSTLVLDGGVLGINTTQFVGMKDFIATAATDGTDLTVSGLNGDTDGNYDIDADVILKAGAGATNFVLRPFGANDNNLQSFNSLNVVNSISAGSQRADWVVGTENTAGLDVHVLVHAHVTSKSGRFRFYWASETTAKSGSIYNLGYANGVTTDTASVISALTIHCLVASHMGAGSYMKVRALGSTN